ncbi:GNAT family N-acetyltransferase [Synechocystis sp. PCC 7339]|uniref:GNAT family N-acetyltransferase n=1 Tax=Synechocystis sp. PCC 7338 TaxID=2732530 RepID=UPI00210755A2|nr:hypothetical protein [Synechocystis sp. PCC 7339]
MNRYPLDHSAISSLKEDQNIVDLFVQPTDDTYTRWVLVNQADGQPIGTCGFQKWAQRNRPAKIGYTLTPGVGYRLLFFFSSCPEIRVKQILHIAFLYVS